MNTAPPLGVIPARAASTRFPNKIIHPILGKPMIQYVWEAACRAKHLSEVLVATDALSIKESVEGFGGKAIVTPADLQSGTDRVAMIARDRKAEIVVNIQGDEPFIQPEAIDSLVKALTEDAQWDVSTLAVLKMNSSEAENPNVVKVAFSQTHQAVHFSRKAIGLGRKGEFYKHIGIYAYRRDSLMRFCSLIPSPLEISERLEQLRALENGFKIKVVLVDADTVSVDTPADIERAEAFLLRRKGVC